MRGVVDKCRDIEASRNEVVRPEARGVDRTRAGKESMEMSWCSDLYPKGVSREFLEGGVG